MSPESPIPPRLSVPEAIDPLPDPGPALAPADDPPVRMSLALRRVDGDVDLLAELVEMFREDLPAGLHELQEAIGRGDHAETRRLAHSFRGSLGFLGAERAVVLAEELEAAGLEARFEDAAAVWMTFEREAGRVTEFFASRDWKSRP